MRWPMTWRALQTLNEPSGKPMVVASGELAEWLEARGITAQVTISDERDYAVSFVIAETADSAAPAADRPVEPLPPEFLNAALVRRILFFQ